VSTPQEQHWDLATVEAAAVESEARDAEASCASCGAAGAGASVLSCGYASEPVCAECRRAGEGVWYATSRRRPEVFATAPIFCP
jgi:hypothetical protein